MRTYMYTPEERQGGSASEQDIPGFQRLHTRRPTVHAKRLDHKEEQEQLGRITDTPFCQGRRGMNAMRWNCTGLKQYRSL